MDECCELFLPDEAATEALGRRLAASCQPGDVIALLGNLGAGKTTLVHGLAAGLAIAGPVPSPTFVILREYAGRLRLSHIDAYRLADADEALATGLDEHLPFDGVTAVEWAERIEELLPENTLRISLTLDGDGRSARCNGPELSRWGLSQERADG